WLGKALRAAADPGGAQTAWTAARDADPRGFYGLRAVDLLEGRADPRAAVDVTRPMVERHMQDALPVGSDVPGTELADQLLSLGLRQRGIWSRDALPDSAELGAWEQKRGLYNPALLLGFRLRAQPPQLLYPLVHPAVLQQLDVDPL